MKICFNKTERIGQMVKHILVTENIFSIAEQCSKHHNLEVLRSFASYSNIPYFTCMLIILFLNKTFMPNFEYLTKNSILKVVI